MSVQSVQSSLTDMAVLNVDNIDDKKEVYTNKGFKYLPDDSSFASTSHGLTEVDEFSERRTVNDNPLLPYNVVEDRSVIESIPYRSTGSFLLHFASGWDTVLMAVATICGIGAGVTLAVHMYIFGEITDVFTQQSNKTVVFDLIGDDSIGYVGLSFAAFILSALNMYLWCIVKERQLIRIRQLLIQSLFTKDMAWFDRHGASQICSQRLSDIETLELGMGETLAMSVQWVSASVALLINALVQSINVTGVIFPYFPCILLASVGSYLIIKSYTKREKEGKSLVKTKMIQTIKNLRTISAFQSQKFESKKLFKAFRFARIMTFRKYLCFGIKSGSFWMLTFFILATGGWYGSYLVLEGRASPGDTIQAILSILMGAIFIGQFYPYLECIMKAKAAAHDLINVLDESPVINQNQKTGKDLPIGSVNIEFADVHFHYPSEVDAQTLNGFRLKIKPNQTIALVGSTGCGKSSVLQLVLRFYDPQKGQVLINAIDIKKMKLHNIRRYIGVVSQKASLLAISIADNIRLGHEAVTIEQIVNAAKLANAHDFIMDLPEGYNSIIGDAGIGLKDDEILRISLARALVRNPKILLLDEVTSALDNASEEIVLEAIEKARTGRTTIITSHRLVNIRNADLIVAMKDGKAIEQGTHRQLMERGGLYYEMWKVQSCMPKDKTNYIFEIDEDTKTKKGDNNWMVVYSHRKEEQNSEFGTSEDFSTIQDCGDYQDIKAPSFNFTLLKRLLKLNLPEWSYGVIGSFTSICVGLIGPLYALFIAEFIHILSLPSADDQYTDRRNAAAQLLVVGAFLAPINYLQNFCFSQCDSKLTLRMRVLTGKALLKQEMNYFDNPNKNRNSLTNIFIRDAVDINGATILKFAMGLQAVSCIIGSIVISFIYCWQLAIPMLGVFFPILMILSYLTGRLYTPMRVYETNRLKERMRKMTQEAFVNIKTLAILVKEEHFIRKCRDICLLMYRNKMTEAIKFALIFGFNEGIVYCAFAFAFSIGSYLVQNGMVDFQNIYKVVGTVVIGSMVTGRIFWNTPDFRRGTIAAERLFPLIEMVPDEPATEEENKSSLEQCKGALSFENVTFKDPNQPDRFVLDDFSMSINAGETVAIVGANDFEKKAIVELTERLYSPLSGTIKLDNVGIQSQRLDWFRSQISVVKQEALFPDISIAENILYGSTSEITEAIETCKSLNIHELLVSLPNGYDTKLEDVVLPFHPQRLIIARALLRDAQIVFIDSESLALNLPSEKDVQETLFRALAEKTTIILAHRVCLVKNVNKIVVVDQGRGAEVGAHDDLMAAEGIYYRLSKCQQNIKERF